jgi:hypothetical protein
VLEQSSATNESGGGAEPKRSRGGVDGLRRGIYGAIAGRLIAQRRECRGPCPPFFNDLSAEPLRGAILRTAQRGTLYRRPSSRAGESASRSPVSPIPLKGSKLLEQHTSK